MSDEHLRETKIEGETLASLLLARRRGYL